MENKHTPTPWAISDTSRRFVEDMKALKIEAVNNDDTPTIATLERQRGKHTLINENFMHDAEFLVRAVNTHDELVEALEIALRIISSDERHFSQVTGEANSGAAVALVKALTKAGAE